VFALTSRVPFQDPAEDDKRRARLASLSAQEQIEEIRRCWSGVPARFRKSMSAMVTHLTQQTSKGAQFAFEMLQNADDCAHEL
jgi:hypothetical protein